MPYTLTFFIILLAGLVFSALLSRFRFPWVVALIVGGIIIGPYGINLVEIDPTIEFLGEIGLIFLMFMAGLSTKLSTFRENTKNISTFALLNGGIPFLAGLSLALVFGYNLVTAIILGIIFISSSVAVIVPTLRSAGLLKQTFGRIVLASTIIEDTLSLILLVATAHIYQKGLGLSFVVSYFLAFLFIMALRRLIPKLKWLFLSQKENFKDLFEQELRFFIAILFGIVVLFGALGIEAIIAGFFAGLILSGLIESKLFKIKLKAIGYGIFIPVFLVIVGMKTNVMLLLEVRQMLLFAVLLILLSAGAKLFSGWLAIKLSGQTNREGLILGAATIPQLTTTLAATEFAITKAEILDPSLRPVIIALSIATTFTGPFLVKYFSARTHKQEQKYE